jgi:penicillin-binding protein 2
MLIFDQLNRADRHLRVLAWVFAAGLLVLVAGVWWLQVVRSRHYVEGERNQSYRTVRVPAPRGKILDRNGVPLAENRPAFNVSLYLEDRALRDAFQAEYKKRRAEIQKAATGTKHKVTSAELKALARSSRYFVVSNLVAEVGGHLDEPLLLNEKNFHQHYEQRLALPMPLRSSLTSTQIARLQERSLGLPGVDMEVQPLRFYPQGTVAAHVLGYLTRSEESAQDELSYYNYRLPDFRGVSGIERSFDEKLSGRAGAKSVLVNNLGYRQTETVLSPVEAGHDVTLTIDAEIQRVAERALASAVTRANPVRGGAAVLDVNSGEIIALASVPSYDPNRFVPRISTDDWAEYNNTNGRPLLHRAVYGGHHPGSTFKIFVALSALESGVLNPDEIFHSDGHIMVGTRRVDDTAGAGDFNFRRAFVKSSNPYFIHYGQKAGPERLIDISHKLYFGERTGIPLGQDSRGILPTLESTRLARGRWVDGDTANMSIGQGDLTVTPLQLAVATAAVANGGKVLWPQLVLSVRAQNELIDPAKPPRVQPRVRGQLGISRQSLEVVRRAMLADVEDEREGSGHKAFVPDYRVCGKTGTAEVWIGQRKDHYDVWFASYAPYDNPRYAVVVMVEYGASGGGTAAPIAGKIFTALKNRDQRSNTASDNSLAQFK